MRWPATSRSTAPAPPVPDLDPLRRLPHTGPARLPDEVLSLDPRVRAVAVKRLARGAPYLNAGGYLPAMMLVELMAQVGGLLIDEEGVGPAQHAVLAGVTRMHLHAAARAGETVQVECRLDRRFGDLYRIECASRVGSRELAHGIITLRRSRAEGPSSGGAARGAGRRA